MVCVISTQRAHSASIAVGSRNRQVVAASSTQNSARRLPSSGSAANRVGVRANRMLSWGLQTRIGNDVAVTACHPGGVNTRIYDNLSGIGAAVMSVGRRLLKTPAEGACLLCL